VKISTFATHATAHVSVVTDPAGLCTAASGKTGILYNAMQLLNRQVTGFVNGDGIMQDSNQHMLGGV
jgi:muramidase (phage lysozyme)